MPEPGREERKLRRNCHPQAPFSRLRRWLLWVLWPDSSAYPSDSYPSASPVPYCGPPGVSRLLVPGGKNAPVGWALRASPRAFPHRVHPLIASLSQVTPIKSGPKSPQGAEPQGPWYQHWLRASLRPIRESHGASAPEWLIGCVGPGGREAELGTVVWPSRSLNV